MILLLKDKRRNRQADEVSYGLKQEPKQWHQKFNRVIIDYGL